MGIHAHECINHHRSTSSNAPFLASLCLPGALRVLLDALQLPSVLLQHAFRHLLTLGQPGHRQFEAIGRGRRGCSLASSSMSSCFWASRRRCFLATPRSFACSKPLDHLKAMKSVPRPPGVSRICSSKAAFNASLALSTTFARFGRSDSTRGAGSSTALLASGRSGGCGRSTGGWAIGWAIGSGPFSASRNFNGMPCSRGRAACRKRGSLRASASRNSSTGWRPSHQACSASRKGCRARSKIQSKLKSHCKQGFAWKLMLEISCSPKVPACRPYIVRKYSIHFLMI